MTMQKSQNRKPWHLSKENLPALIEILKDYLAKGKTPVIQIRESTRSDEQNKRLWGYLYPSVANHLAIMPDELHTLMGYKFLRDIREVNNESFEYIKSTTKLSVSEMAEYQRNVEIWATELGWSTDV